MIPRIDLPKAPDPHVDPAGYLRSIGSVRERCAPVLEKALKNQLQHFDVDMSKFEDTTSFVVSIIKVCILRLKLGERANKAYSGILLQTTLQFLPMEDGNTSA